MNRSAVSKGIELLGTGAVRSASCRGGALHQSLTHTGSRSTTAGSCYWSGCHDSNRVCHRRSSGIRLVIAAAAGRREGAPRTRSESSSRRGPADQQGSRADAANCAAPPSWASDTHKCRRPSVAAAFVPSAAWWFANVVTAPSGPAMQQSTFSGSSVHDLRAWLEHCGLDTAPYGSPPAKSLEELLEEVELGESVLQVKDGRLVRVVRVLNVFIENCRGEVLMEEQQVKPCGTVRARGLPLSEKLKAGESWEPAVHRALTEELGSVLPEQPKIEILKGTFHVAVESRTSNSYPGLNSEYHCHRVKVKVDGLPDTERFISVETRPNGILQNHWVWQPSPVL